MSELVKEQQKFSALLGLLLTYIATETEYRVTMGETWRTPEQAQWNVEHGLGIKNSLHCDRLAADLNFFSANGHLVPGPDSVGVWWESQGGAWGGRFNDPNHFSLAYGGRK
jgi:hypothetical protein